MEKSSPSPALSGPSTTSGDGDEPRKPPRKLHRSPNQLHRNQACLTCRRRRIKCDAGRPHCSSCIRSFRFLARRQPDPERDARGVQCEYEHNEEVEEQDAHAAVAKLQGRVAEFHGELDRLTSRPSGSSSSGTSNRVHGFEMAPNAGVNAPELSATSGPPVNSFDTTPAYGPSGTQTQHHGQVAPLHEGNLHGRTGSSSANEHRPPVNSHRSFEQNPALQTIALSQIFQPVWPNPEQDQPKPHPQVCSQQQMHFPPTQYDASFPYGASLPVTLPISTDSQHAHVPPISAPPQSSSWAGNTYPFHPLESFDPFSPPASDPISMSQVVDTMGMPLFNNTDRRDSDQ